ncbi:MAG: hypothetical protein KAV82_04210 [Phycisphaerae bacterium]|nr:hypothetical protein [Phycisphaerae bacterium]
MDYNIEKIPDTTRVVNPAYRELDGKIRSKNGILNRKLAEFGGLSLKGEINPANVESHIEEKAALLEESIALQEEIEEFKSKRKAVARHILVADLSEQESFQRLSAQSKHLLDTIKMIAYRAETAMVYTLREKMSRRDDARGLAQGIFSAEADILPDQEQGTLTIRLHHLANPCADAAVRHLCRELNSTNTEFPGTQLRLVYDLVSCADASNEET